MSADRVSSWIMPPLNLETDPTVPKEETSYSNSVTPKAGHNDFFFETDSEKSLCTMMDQNRNTSSVDMSSSSKSQDTLLMEECKECSTIVQLHNTSR